jgi:hypothetical protein
VGQGAACSLIVVLAGLPRTTILQSRGAHQPRHCASRHVLALPPQFAAQTLRTPIRPGSCRRRPVRTKTMSRRAPAHSSPAPATSSVPAHPSSDRREVRRSHAPCLTRLRRVCAMQPIFAAIDPIAAHSEALLNPARLATAPRVRICSSFALSSLHPLKSCSLRQSRCRTTCIRSMSKSLRVGR